MFDIGGVELIVVAAIAILVVGPRELPGMLRAIGRFVKQARQMTTQVQRQFNDALREAELDDVKRTIDDVRSLNPARQIKQTIARELKPLSDVGNTVKSTASAARTDVSQAAKAAAPAVAASAAGASTPARAATPVKTGATATTAGTAPEPEAAAAPSAKAPVKRGTASTSKSAGAKTAKSAGAKPAGAKTPKPAGAKAASKAPAASKPRTAKPKASTADGG